MKKLFNKRRSLFLTQNSKYLRYVFNDHFVLVLMFLSGFLLYQYSQLLKTFQKHIGNYRDCVNHYLNVTSDGGNSQLFRTG